jgi:hypothetical protein
MSSQYKVSHKFTHSLTAWRREEKQAVSHMLHIEIIVY